MYSAVLFPLSSNRRNSPTLLSFNVWLQQGIAFVSFLIIGHQRFASRPVSTQFDPNDSSPVRQNAKAIIAVYQLEVEESVGGEQPRLLDPQRWISNLEYHARYRNVLSILKQESCHLPEMLWRDLFCVCLLTAAVQSMAEGGTRDVSKKHENEVSFKDLQSVETGSWSHGKPKRLFARRGFLHRQKPVLQRVPKPKQFKQPKQQPALQGRRCPRVMESCVPHSPCCDPCASCHCRFFNTICYCWRMGRHCQKKT